MARIKDSIRARLILGATLVLLAFVVAAGWAVQRAHADSVRTARLASLQSTVYLLLAGAELDSSGALVMPAAFPEPRLSLSHHDAARIARVSPASANRRKRWLAAARSAACGSPM